MRFQHTAARRRLEKVMVAGGWFIKVSTHSRPKAAGFASRDGGRESDGFNTQPPEGGWFVLRFIPVTFCVFQHTAARRRLVLIDTADIAEMMFQHTAARRRLGVWPSSPEEQAGFQHTAARRRLAEAKQRELIAEAFQHTAARRRLGERT